MVLRTISTSAFQRDCLYVCKNETHQNAAKVPRKLICCTIACDRQDSKRLHPQCPIPVFLLRLQHGRQKLVVAICICMRSCSNTCGGSLSTKRRSSLSTKLICCPVNIFVPPQSTLAHVLQQQVRGLTRRKAELQAENQKPSLGPEDQRAALLAKVKADNEACEAASQTAKQANEAIRQLERQGVTAQPIRSVRTADQQAFADVNLQHINSIECLSKIGDSQRPFHSPLFTNVKSNKSW